MILARTEKVRQDEKEALAQMTNELYDKTSKMGALQAEIEEITSKNQTLEQDFEAGINQRNEQQKEVRQIIDSIDNIFKICQKVRVK